MWRLPVLFLFLTASAKAGTGDSLRYLFPYDTLYLTISMGEMITSHQVAPGQTLFSLAQFYGLSVEEVKYYNPGMSDQLRPDQEVRIPIPTRSILRYKPDTFRRWDFTPLFYRVRAGDTVYGLSTRFFKMPPDSVYQRLDRWEGTLRTGQLFFVGWMSTQGVPQAFRGEGGHPLFRANHKLRKHFIRYANEGKKRRNQSGAAQWSEDSGQSNHYALHNQAPLNSYIKITNPMRRRHVYAKVVGRLPRSTPPNIQIILTSLSAKLLGARDPRFYVEIEYYQ